MGCRKWHSPIRSEYLSSPVCAACEPNVPVPVGLWQQNTSISFLPFCPNLTFMLLLFSPPFSALPTHCSALFWHVYALPPPALVTLTVNPLSHFSFFCAVTSVFSRLPFHPARSALPVSTFRKYFRGNLRCRLMVLPSKVHVKYFVLRCAFHFRRKDLRYQRTLKKEGLNPRVDR